MNERTQEQVRRLAYHIWASAEQHYGRSIDFWVMAEQMVGEMAAVTKRMRTIAMAQSEQDKSQQRHVVTPADLVAAHADQVRQLAHIMWENAEKRAGYTMDFWLAAERHTRAIAEAAMRTAGANVGAERVVAQAFQAFSPDHYHERIRRTAYYMWEAAGGHYGRSLDFWLAAERQVLQSMASLRTLNRPNEMGDPQRGDQNDNNRSS